MPKYITGNITKNNYGVYPENMASIVRLPKGVALGKLWC